ncbi:hypothetical protein FY148_10680 [Agrobacterium tumefaciens]|uniref:hypothetical protein n=1 Tax=Agrobacterium tumefaciens TaxID=358 RepID=UPI0021CE0433|nr:hypothetical protein [Agrobacterium tumefaciens]UXS53083.1 hypothetical protein FY148_10680 [Agrobacterium tumefaciens]UXS63327.1 hypothetical protein FY147_10680 [Agrobacterium tumefaciens]
MSLKRLHSFLTSEDCFYCITAITGVVLGLVVGFAAGGVFLGSCAGISDAPFGCVEFLLFRYQTLITGFFALGGAWLLWVQIQDQRAQAKQAKKQREIAARIRIPHALSKLSVYWKHCYDAWVERDIERKTQEVPFDAIETVMAAASEADPETFQTITKLTILSQAFEARIRPLRDVGKRQRLNLMIVDIARLNYLTDSLYEYGRLETDAVPYLRPDRDTLQKQLDRYLPYRRDHEVNQVIGRIEQAFDSQFGKRPDARSDADDDDDFEPVDDDFD